MLRRKLGEEKKLEFDDPCFDMNSKDYIRRDDLEAEKFKIKRMRADVARSVQQHDIRQNFTTHNKKLFGAGARQT